MQDIKKDLVEKFLSEKIPSYLKEIKDPIILLKIATEHQEYSYRIASIIRKLISKNELTEQDLFNIVTYETRGEIVIPVEIFSIIYLKIKSIVESSNKKPSSEIDSFLDSPFINSLNLYSEKDLEGLLKVITDLPGKKELIKISIRRILDDSIEGFSPLEGIKGVLNGEVKIPEETICILISHVKKLRSHLKLKEKDKKERSIPV